MSDITLTVAFSVAAIAVTLLLTSRVAITVARTLSYTAMAILGAHTFGVTISAPIPSSPADTLNIIALVWLLAATFALCARGFLRLIYDKREALNGS